MGRRPGPNSNPNDSLRVVVRLITPIGDLATRSPAPPPEGRVDLAPCPFCAAIPIKQDLGGGRWRVDGCCLVGATFWENVADSADADDVRAWNRRAVGIGPEAPSPPAPPLAIDPPVEPLVGGAGRALSSESHADVTAPPFLLPPAEDA